MPDTPTPEIDSRFPAAHYQEGRDLHDEAPARPTICTGHVPCGDESRTWCRVCPKHDRAGGGQP